MKIFLSFFESIYSNIADTNTPHPPPIPYQPQSHQSNFKLSFLENVFSSKVTSLPFR